MRIARLGLLGVALVPLGVCPNAWAQTDKGGVRAAAGSQEPAPPGDLAKDEILIVAQRYGEAEVAAETEFSEEEIASHGADSIQDLLARLQPFIGGDGEEPVLLINGKPAEFDRSIVAFPAEALNRLAVLKPEAAARYGYPSGRRVVNLVLKKHFSSLNADAAGNFATGGGQYGGSLSVNRSAIDGPVRWSVQGRMGHDSGLRKSARNIPPRAGVFDRTGYVSAPAGGEIDPALSLAAGTAVTIAGIPSRALSGMPTLADFAATAGDTDPVDPNDFETLMPSRSNMALSIGVSRPIGTFSVSLGVDANRTSSRGMRGLVMASILVPDESPWSPFAGDVLLTRPFARGRVLRSDNDAESVSASLTLGGAIGGWKTSFSISYGRSWSNSLLESGIDTGRVQQLVDGDDPAFNPYGPWDDRLLLARRNRSQGENIATRFNVRKNIVNLPAGPLSANLSVNASRNRSRNWRGDNLGLPDAGAESTRERLDGALGLSVPISRPGEGEILSLGSLSLDLNASAQTMTNSQLQKRYGIDLNWLPNPSLQLRGAFGHAGITPSFNQLDDPIVATINRIFDYSRGEIAEPIWITGGNPALRRGSRQNLSMEAMVRPLGNQILSLSVSYKQDTANGGVAAFPELTPVIEAAFPERVLRDADGRLVSVDARPINIAHATESELSSGIALRFPGKPPARGADPIQLSLALGHRWRLKSELLTHPGVPVIDQFAQSGQSRHSLSFQTTVGKAGWGATLSSNWSGGSRVTNGDRVLNTKPPVMFNLSMFVDPERLSKTTKKGGLLDNLKISLNVQNLFNGYRRVTLEDGSTPPGFTRDEIDPLGRTVRLTVRKRF